MFGLVTNSLLAVLASILLYKYFKSRRFWKLYGEFKGDKPLPFIGNAHLISSNTEEFFKIILDMWERHGKSTFKLQVGNDPMLFLCDAEYVEVILRSTKEISKTDDYESLKPFFGNGLVTSDGDEWRTKRKILNNAFHFKILDHFVDVFNNKGKILIKKFKLLAGKNPIDVCPHITAYALDNVCETIMGFDLKPQEGDESEFATAIQVYAELAHRRSFSVLNRIDFFYQFTEDHRNQQKALKILNDMTDRVIRMKKMELEAKKIKSTEDYSNDLENKFKISLADLLINSRNAKGEPFTEKDIRYEINTFISAGHDTTASAMSFCIYLLANNEEVQNRVFEEQYSIFGNDLITQPSQNDLKEMTYLDRVAKETLRMYPTVPFFSRKNHEDLNMPDGKVIPAGTSIVVLPILMNRNPKYFPEPSKFDPDRFLPESAKDVRPFTYVPFSAGPRNCIGQRFAILEMKSAISAIVRNFVLRSAGPEYEPRLATEILLKSVNGVHVVIEPRGY